MLTRAVFIALILALSQFSVRAQIRIEQSIPLEANIVATDVLGNIYLAGDNQLIKFSSEFTETHRYSIKNKGRISSVDASDPFKVLIYFADFSQLVWLDNTLTPTGKPVELTDLDFPLASHACWSHNNCFWIFDPASVSLIRININLQTTNKSAPLNVLTYKKFEVQHMRESGNYLFVSSPADEVLIFDRFGTYFRTIKAHGTIAIHYDPPSLFLISTDSIKHLNMINFTEETIELPVKNCISASISRDKIYLLQKGFLHIGINPFRNP